MNDEELSIFVFRLIRYFRGGGFCVLIEYLNVIDYKFVFMYGDIRRRFNIFKIDFDFIVEFELSWVI